MPRITSDQFAANVAARRDAERQAAEQREHAIAERAHALEEDAETGPWVVIEREWHHRLGRAVDANGEWTRTRSQVAEFETKADAEAACGFLGDKDHAVLPAVLLVSY
ncbi:MAG: hypothetical protein AB7H92_14120 [Microbacteriaceae bacterium]